MKRKKLDGRAKVIAELASLGIQFPVSIGIGYGMGWLLDRWLGWYPVMTIIFSLFGVAAAFVNLFRLNAELGRIEKREQMPVGQPDQETEDHGTDH